MAKDKRKRLTVALNLDDQTRERLNFICESEHRTPTQQIEFFISREIYAWWREHKETIETLIETSPQVADRFEKAGIPLRGAVSYKKK